MRRASAAITSVLLLMPGACAASGRGRAAAGSPPVRVTWVRPGRVSPAQRVALTRLLEAAVQGRPLRGFLVRDSHPTLPAEGIPVARR